MSTLLKAISDSDTIIMFSEDAAFPVTFGVILIGTEQIAYDSNYNGTLYGCVRGYNSTSAAAHLVGVSLSLFGFYHGLAGQSGSFTSVTVSGLTASRAVVTDGSKGLASSATTATELSYVSGATSNLQTQINAISSVPPHTTKFVLDGGVGGNITTTNAGTWVATQLTASITPHTATSSIQINLTGSYHIAGAGTLAFTLYRDGATIWGSYSQAEIIKNDTGGLPDIMPVNISWLDVPGNTSAHTYTLYVHSDTTLQFPAPSTLALVTLVEILT